MRGSACRGVGKTAGSEELGDIPASWPPPATATCAPTAVGPSPAHVVPAAQWEFCNPPAARIGAHFLAT